MRDVIRAYQRRFILTKFINEKNLVVKDIFAHSFMMPILIEKSRSIVGGGECELKSLRNV